MDQYLIDLLERIKKPISDDAPCGENARYDERYDKAKNEIMKMTAGAAGLDWRDLRESIDALLSEKTKDLTLAAYLCLALLKEYEYPGLLAGIQIVDYFVDTWWETMFPPLKRKKARIQIFEWMDDRLSVLAGVTQAKVEHADALRQSIEILTELPDKVQNLVKAPVTGFSRIKTEINQWIEKLPAPEPEPEPEPPVKEEPKAADSVQSEAAPAAEEASPSSEAPVSEMPPAHVPPAQRPAGGGELELPEPIEELGNLDDGLSAIMNIVKLMRQAEPLSPIVYRLSRVLKWDVVTAIPPAGGDGKTKIPAPSQQVLIQLQKQLEASKWAALIQSAEHMFVTKGVFFMDLQRYAHQGLSNLGAESAADVVMMETGRLLNRFPELLNLTYVSGLPFADDQTQQWAADAMKAAAGPGSGGDEGEDNAWLKDATKVASKNMASALPILQNAVSKAESIKNVMKKQRDVAKFFISNREFHWAMPLLESLHDKIETVGLAEWDPDYCSDVWELMLKGYEALPKGPETTGKDNAHKLRIRQLLFEANVAKGAATTPKEKIKKK